MITENDLPPAMLKRFKGSGVHLKIYAGKDFNGEYDHDANMITLVIKKGTSLLNPEFLCTAYHELGHLYSGHDINHTNTKREFLDEIQDKPPPQYESSHCFVRE